MQQIVNLRPKRSMGVQVPRPEPIYMRNQEQDIEIVIPDQCPKCHSKNVLCSDWKDNYLIYLRITCQDCHFFWRETVDLTI